MSKMNEPERPVSDSFVHINLTRNYGASDLDFCHEEVYILVPMPNLKPLLFMFRPVC